METAETILVTKAKRRCNWWMIAFFILLIVFEFTRELVVIEAKIPPQIAATAFLYHNGDFSSAQGALVRTDRGSALIPTNVAIQCDKEIGQCIEVNVHMSDNTVSAPNISRYKAQFSPDGITYTKDDAACAVYKVRLDYATEKVISVLEPKSGPKAICDLIKIERMTMELRNGFHPSWDYLKDSFIPLFRAIQFFNR